MSRRRRKSPLLGRMLLISIGVNVIALPILAHFGAFKKIEASMHEATVVLVKPTDMAEDKDKPKSKEEKKSPPKKTPSAKGPSAKRSGTPLKANPNAPKVVTAAGDGASSGDGAPAIQQGTGKAGEIPPTANKGGSANVPSEKTPPVVTPHSTEPQPKGEPKTTVPVQPKSEPKRAAIYREPEVASGPEPVIPDDLRNENLEATFIAEFNVGPDGVPTDVSAAKSTGNKELDQIAIEAARKWRFKPATVDGKGVASKVRLRMEFTVE